jgi:general stress protein 26
METRTLDGVTTLRELIEGIRFAMLVTVGPDGRIRSRPMTTADAHEDDALYFLVHKGGMLVSDVRADEEVNVSYADPERLRFVSVSGRARVVEDRGLLEHLWKPAYRAFFANGLEDPDLSLLRVSVERAQTWDMPSRPLADVKEPALTEVDG